ncbi:MAG: hypothetical protein HGA84_06565, partial [Syntrophobacteraceae bacterium]|nr:hypothetical protein [Syntrophobacteraceae bacterium]
SVNHDFYLYGPIENAPMVFPAAAMVDIMKAESAEEIVYLIHGDLRSAGNPHSLSPRKLKVSKTGK